MREAMRTVSVEKVRILASKNIAMSELDVDIATVVDMATDELILQLRTHLHAIGTEEICWPANWIEAVKDRWLPLWIKSRWPVKYTHRRVYAAVCPHLNTDDVPEHIVWLREHYRE